MGAGNGVRFDFTLLFSEVPSISGLGGACRGPDGVILVRVGGLMTRDNGWGPLAGTPGWRPSFRRPESGPPAPPRLTGSSVNPEARSKDRQLWKALGRGRDYDPEGRCPFGTQPTTQPENRVSGSLDLRAMHISQPMNPVHSRRPDVSRASADRRPCPHSPGTQAQEAETSEPSLRRPGAFKAARRSRRLQCAPLPDRDQHRSTLRAAHRPVCQAEAPGHPPSSPSRAQAARQPSGSDPLRVPARSRAVGKKFTDAVSPTPIPIWGAELLQKLL